MNSQLVGAEDELRRQGFTKEEIAVVFWLRQWYQSGGSDRAEVVRRLEFIRFLVESGRMEA